jgi:hypothetical protein
MRYSLPHISRNFTLTVLFTMAVVLVGSQSLATGKLFRGDDLGMQRNLEAVMRTNGTDTDRDGLTDWTELRRTRTNPRKADTDGDGLSDGTEVKRTRTNPRKADSDGDGASDGEEILGGTDPWDPASVPSPNPPPPAPDTTAPETSITSSPPATTTATSASFSFTSSESGSSFECGLDGAFGPCASPTSYSGLALGSHTFEVRATDAAGNVDESPAVRTWTVEAPAEEPEEEEVQAVWEAPENPQVNVPVTLDGAASTGDGDLTCIWSFENWDGSIVWQTREGCVIGFTFEGSGVKYVSLIVEDTDGEVDSSKQAFTVAPGGTPPPVDTSPPDTTIESGPAQTTTATSATFSFSSSEPGSTYQCQLDASAWAECSSPKTYSELSTGAHSLLVRATDAAGNTDQSPASRSWTVEAGTPPPQDTTPPNTTITSSPPATTTATSASFSFNSSESGSSFECGLDGAFGPCASPTSYSGLALGSHTFEVRATDAAGNVDESPAVRTWTILEPEPEPEPEPENPPPGGSCATGMTNATSASAVTSAISAGKSTCVTADIGNVNFNGMGNRSGVVVSTEGGSMGQLEISGTTGLTIRSARFRSITIRGADQTTIEGSTIGGTPTNRVLDQLIFMPDTSNDVTIRNNDIGWTRADDSGNTGYGCRCYGTLNRLKFVGNKIHDIAADGFQGVGGSDVLIDRNEIGPVGANPDSSEHSDNIQITGNGPNLRITNNWIHHQGYFEGEVTGNAGSTYIHGGETNSLTYENNLVEIARGRTEICGLGTGGTSRSNITIRRNTWVEGGQAFTGFPGFEWDCDSGSGNVVERNIAVDPDGGFAQDGSTGAATFTSNLWGQPSLVTLDANGNCTSANCNPAGQEPIGYRKPSGVSW